MKRTLSLVLTLALVMSLFAFAPAQAAPKEIVFWTGLSGNLGEAVQHIVDGFNASQDDWKVVVEYQGSYYDIAAKLQTAVVTGDEPDIVQSECTRVSMFSEYGIFEELTDECAEYGVDISGLYAGFMADCDWGKGLYALPFNRSTPMFYYNKTLFDENGLQAPTTWEELHETAKKLSIPDTRWGFEVPIDYWFYQCFIKQSGGEIMNADNTDIGFNNETGWAPIEWLRGMLEDGSMKAPPGAEFNSWEAARNDLATGVTTMIITSSGDLKTLMNSCDFEVGTAFLPANKNYGVVTGGANIAVLAGHEENMEGIMKFLAYVISPEIAGWWAAETGYVPTSDAAAQTQVYQDYLAKNAAGSTALAQMEYASNQPSIPQFVEIGAEFMMDEFQRVIEDKSVTPADCTQKISEQARKLLGTK